MNQAGATEEFSERGPWIISSRGFRVRALGRAGMEYVEGGKSLHVDSEALAVPTFVVYALSLPADERTSIIDNLTRAWRSSGFDIEVQE